MTLRHIFLRYQFSIFTFSLKLISIEVSRVNRGKQFLPFLFTYTCERKYPVESFSGNTAQEIVILYGQLSLSTLVH